MGIDKNSENVGNVYTPSKGGGVNIIDFFQDLFPYLILRLRQLFFFLFAFLTLIINGFEELKDWMVQRMFWGRGSFYRTSFHIIIFVLTLVIVVSGISTKLNISAQAGGLALNDSVIGRKDLIIQAGTAEALSVISANEADFEVYKYIVQQGDTLSSIAKIYNKDIFTLVWANNLSSKDAILKVGQVLRIPAINGAYYKVKSGDTLEKIAKYTNSNAIDIWDLNSNIIDYDNPVLAVGMELFVPGGIIPTTAPPKKVITGGTKPNTGLVVPSGSFVHPLLHCPGWSWSRGYSSYHGGVDMAKGGGCWINSIGNGYVKKAGWGGWGFTTIIDHGNGLVSIYGHGTGQYAVKAGDYVKAGQDIMYMGNSGYSFGTHLHIELQLNGGKVNPESYVKLR